MDKDNYNSSEENLLRLKIKTYKDVIKRHNEQTPEWLSNEFKENLNNLKEELRIIKQDKNIKEKVIQNKKIMYNINRIEERGIKEMKYLKLENYIEQDINKEHLERMGLEPTNIDESARMDLWRKKISGSKMKDVSNRPLTTIAYLLGLISEEEWKGVLNFIPRMNYYRDHGKFAENHIINMFNTAIENEGSDDEDKTKFKDLLIDFPSISRVKEIFTPAMNEKYKIKADKRTLFRTGNKYSNIFMLNLDGYTENDDGTIRHIIEVKTKTGSLGNNLDYAGYMALHLDQVVYYATLAGATDGAVILIDHWSRGMKVHTISKREIDNHWEGLVKRVRSIGLIVSFIRDKGDINKVLDELETIDWGDEKEELITKEQLKNHIQLMGKGV